MPRYRLQYGTYTDSETGEHYDANSRRDEVELDEATAAFLGDQVVRIARPKGRRAHAGSEDVAESADGVAAAVADASDAALEVGESVAEAVGGASDAAADEQPAGGGQESEPAADEGGEAEAEAEAEPEEESESERETPTADDEAAAAGSDDFRVLDGIGPKRNQALHESGYLTFADLSSAVPSELSSAIDGVSEELASGIIDAVTNDAAEAGADDQAGE
jgi:NADH-quinone oxidoreductase subunit E